MFEFKNFSILFVEDDLEIQKNMSKILSLLCNKVYVASNGLEAYEIFTNNVIHIIITDYEMPFINGYDLVLKIREISQNIPIIILSNYTDKEKLLKCIPLNLTSYLEKPIIYEKLLETLQLCKNQIENNATLYLTINDSLKYDFNTKSLIQNGNYIKLTTLEIQIFEYLLNKKNQLVYNDELLSVIFENDYYGNIKNIIYRLRKKVSKDVIVNYKNLGYMLNTK
ncbi:response regulator transcription factor [Aliarcobacter butzleri]|uniref:Response regulator transcription factor n=1 Tax=Aliarcobacter butzleri TaxID=28197 RepID=A0AAW7Q236_9BACT|nr:response regulator transcription factor [Aliarcobacter butzleri]MCG3657840.1 response regulator transcription factor [Aliarcobacter butzleri]MCR8709668.1 response regulator transcription factor [Aliarcobacter butzleri]MDK2040841.1 response regulator transcription factor [Aliarcobacter butzleri]MDK2095679.1 response regulator transcription factor [Aliarcobacter butzleri]MDN5113225.1 response regulator transcription factor [Aliarcobacter butzleri]